MTLAGDIPGTSSDQYLKGHRFKIAAAQEQAGPRLCLNRVFSRIHFIAAEKCKDGPSRYDYQGGRRWLRNDSQSRDTAKT